MTTELPSVLKLYRSELRDAIERDLDRRARHSRARALPIAVSPWLNSPLGRWRGRGFVAAAAAVLLAIGCASYGLSVALGGGARPATGGRSGTLAAGLTAVNGCSSLAAASGTLEQVRGSDVVIKTSNGELVTITTSPSTTVGREASGSLGDINDGAGVFVVGTESNGTVAAATVGVGAVGAVGNLKRLTLPFSKGHDGPRRALPVFIGGTATEANTGGFTVVESDGTSVPVTTSSSTDVNTLTNINVSQLQVGEITVAVGSAGRGGTLEAARVEQDAMQNSPPPLSKQTPSDDQGIEHGSGCSPSTVALDALLSAQ
jgi:hypothetical protein